MPDKTGLLGLGRKPKPLKPENVVQCKLSFEAILSRCNEALKRDARNVWAYQARGVAHYWSGLLGGTQTKSTDHEILDAAIGDYNAAIRLSSGRSWPFHARG